MKRRLWLDDVRNPAMFGKIGWEWARTYDEAISALSTGQISEASLDHDLTVEASLGIHHPGEKTGYSVCCWLEQHPDLFPPEGCHVHSANPAGAQRMRQVLQKHYGRR